MDCITVFDTQKAMRQKDGSLMVLDQDCTVYH